MAIMSRIVRLFKADLHGVMDQIEDRPLLYRQYLREMEAALQVKSARWELLKDNLRQLTEAQEEARAEIARIEADLDLALNQNRDDAARFLIRKQHAAEASTAEP